MTLQKASQHEDHQQAAETQDKDFYVPHDLQKTDPIEGQVIESN